VRRHSFLEFLVLYGWVILLILFVFSILAYLGIINKDYVEEVCVFTSDIECVEYYASSSLNESVIVLRNLGTQKTIVNITDDMTDDCDSPILKACMGSVCQPEDLPFTFGEGDLFLLQTSCVTIAEGAFRFNPVISDSVGNILEGKTLMGAR
jgi:hypothetical protein